MSLLATIWPTVFGMKSGNLKAFLINLVILVVGAVLGGLAIGIVGWIGIPFLGTVLKILGLLIDVYCVGGIILSICRFIGVI